MNSMRSKLGFKIQRKKLEGDDLITKWLCNSCGIDNNGYIDEDGWECEEGYCEGAIRSIYDKKFVVKCSGYQEHMFNITEELKEILGKLVEEYSWGSLSGQKNITQQSDNFFSMMDQIYYGLMYTLQHNKHLNRIIRIGKNYSDD